MIKQKWQIKIEDFEDSGWIGQNLAGSHSVYLSVKFNVFTKEAFYFVTKAGIHEIRKDFDEFQLAIDYFNELV